MKNDLAVTPQSRQSKNCGKSNNLNAANIVGKREKNCCKLFHFNSFFSFFKRKRGKFANTYAIKIEMELEDEIEIHIFCCATFSKYCCKKPLLILV